MSEEKLYYLDSFFTEMELNDLRDTVIDPFDPILKKLSKIKPYIGDEFYWIEIGSLGAKFVHLKKPMFIPAGSTLIKVKRVSDE